MIARRFTLASLTTVSLLSLSSLSSVALADSSNLDAPVTPAIASPADQRPPIPTFDRHVPAVHGGLELALSLNSAHAFGDVGGGMSGSELIGSGTEVDLQIGHRLTPHLALGFYTTGQAFTSGSNIERGDVYTGSAGVEVDVHARPGNRVDPWISAGTGVRALLVDADDNELLVGADLVRLQLGIDFRINEDVALGPVIGATASLYGAQKIGMQEFEELSNKGVQWTLSAGFAGRFNAFGSRR